ncbi:MAG TPA: AMED_5909 family protein [Pseudonocardiaceae bacterium]|nr:AMED_5909 family protein [Pseudonocardiaceae bacterium]
MVTPKVTPARPAPVITLQAAHELLHREWPGDRPPVSQALAYHSRAAALYAHVAETDPDHHHEALFWAQQERTEVTELQQSGPT